MEWQDISTAPKSGEYLVFQPETKSGRSVLAERVVSVSHAGCSRKSTHWMHLPSPPKPTHKDKD